jgi:hypothetical protein
MERIVNYLERCKEVEKTGVDIQAKLEAQSISSSSLP